ncbi:kasugamycin N-acetyltransferase AAC(2')-IIb [Paenibacillus alvei]|uniref:kasugamycin N-acetyltransferase AAC(2')-IIb n=1 Tax=Paenibacillus alvei TaxID=44250 RepID=UPI00028A3129|nr:kasugamycin N-acetyltransferase AAC(2')-IIb [Paenibacillus alvei]EJW16311.1 hypothetical protein PAV_6c03930 [Paenibacillus alvei DSM 29]MCY9704361.1 kasugamycin N-acetyltransferase AAC(2')-IIb [Paenibacillus alvei]MCY9737350.1 kasugamycin N-acetyltransferase AAC(2')-IIb [Paenibacillus alvei]MCY9757052.1 kasugamycin N-acetyltransferase AAC(2')-IIb [Paenibacillus alvei]MEC0079715.1 kasugamycin N-acetyltransferase AAC(2')-IIb [Paenibacillus alvei]
MEITNKSSGEPQQYKLMNIHAGVMFTHDDLMRLRTINEPWPGESTAPRFFLGRTIDGAAIWRFRYDVSGVLVEKLEQLCADEPVITDIHTRPKHCEAYMDLLQSDHYTMGPCYYVPPISMPVLQTTSITKDNITDWDYSGFKWLLSEIEYAQPCIGIAVDNKLVSICRSVRICLQAHEAGLETLEAFRGKGYASEAVVGWAQAVRKMNAAPLYSTFCDNLSSQRVAAKCKLSMYGVNFTIK